MRLCSAQAAGKAGLLRYGMLAFFRRREWVTIVTVRA
jgi:hypothetical protein